MGVPQKRLLECKAFGPLRVIIMFLCSYTSKIALNITVYLRRLSGIVSPLSQNSSGQSLESIITIDVWTMMLLISYELQVLINRCLRKIMNVRWPDLISDDKMWRATYQRPIHDQIQNGGELVTNCASNMESRFEPIRSTERRPPMENMDKNVGRRNLGRWKKTLKEVKFLART